MKEFHLGSYIIKYGDNVEFYTPYSQFFYGRAESGEEIFLDKLKKYNTIEDILNKGSREAQVIIDNVIEEGIKILINHQIFDYDLKRIKQESPQSVFTNTSEYMELKDVYDEICEAEEAYNQNKKYNRANRSRWQGGGFGIRGAIKGAVKAGAMNMATDALRGIGDSLQDVSDSSQIKAIKKKLLNNETIELLSFTLNGSILIGVGFQIMSILECRTADCDRW